MTAPARHYCETCDDPNAGWGFDVAYMDGSGLKSVRLWYCYDHKEDGRKLWAEARQMFAAKARPRPAPEPPAQGTLL